MRKLTKRSTAIVAAAVIAVGGAGAAWAAWTMSGTGSASASATTAQGLTVSSATVDASLYPGATVPVTMKVSNPNPFPVAVDSVALTNIATTKSGCDASKNVTILPNLTVPTVGGANKVAAKTGANAVTTDIVIANALKMNADAANACQGAVFTVTANITAASDVQDEAPGQGEDDQ